jgi:hypothetical protein
MQNNPVEKVIYFFTQELIIKIEKILYFCKSII